MSKLSKEQQEVWDRLKHGVPAPRFHTPEEMMEYYSRIHAKEMADEIDKEFLRQLIQEAHKRHK